MLYKYNENNTIEMLDSYDFTILDGLEKDLENLLAENLSDLYSANEQLMPIFQERKMQEEPDLCALDKDGNLIIFELKRGIVDGNATIQVMRYCQMYGQKNYNDLCSLYRIYQKCRTADLRQAHAEAFGLEQPLDYESFNKHQKLIVVGSSANYVLMDAVSYWKKQGIDIDYIPYRFYRIGGEVYFEFFAKPHDYHINTRDRKGILFDTNLTYDENSIWDMFAKHKVSAYGSVKNCVSFFNLGDYVLYYHKGYGVVGAGRIKSPKPKAVPENDEVYMDVELVTPLLTPDQDLAKISISPTELKRLLNKGFYFAKTAKVPYLSEAESKKVIEELGKKYKQTKNQHQENTSPNCNEV